MKIIMVGNFGTSWDGSKCDEENLAESFERLGHEVFRFQREDTLENNWSLPESDIALVAQWGNYHHDLCDKLRYAVKKVFYWAFDYQADGQTWHERLIETCDVYLSKLLSDSRKHPNWRWLAQDFAPNFLRRTDLNIEKDIDFLFTGSFLDIGVERNKFVKLIDDNFNLVVHSVTQQAWTDFGIKDSRPGVVDQGLPELYARAKVVLSADLHHVAGYWSDRNFQTMLCGATVLFRHVPMSESTFGAGVEYFHNEDELLEKARLLLANEQRRDIVGAIGHEIADMRGRASNRAFEFIELAKEFL